MTSSLVMLPALPIGNSASVINMIHKCGGEATLINNPKDLQKADRIVLAGVGAFDTGMKALENGGWLEPLSDIAHAGQIPILGICLGMQLMCRSSEEGNLAGLGWFDAQVKRINSLETSLKVPHMGWNTIREVNINALIPESSEEQRYYFVHSYHVECDKLAEVSATVDYGNELTAAIHKDKLYGVQFHPEKSHRFGMALISRFLDV